MKNILKRLGLTAAALASFALQAQSAIYLSASGSDSNIGSYDAPCKSLSAAYGKVYAGGTIIVMDAMMLGPLTISKSVTIDGGGKAVIVGLIGGDPATGFTLAVNAGASDTVVLRNLTLVTHGGSSRDTYDGIVFSSGKNLVVEHCTFDGFSDAGIDVSVAQAASVRVSDTIFTGSLYGLRCQGASAPVSFSITGTRAVGVSFRGFSLAGRGSSMLKDCSITGASYGLVVFSGDVQAEGMAISQNGCGIQVNSGTLRLSDCAITDNGTGAQVNGGALISYGNNRVDSNGAGNGPFTVIGQK